MDKFVAILIQHFGNICTEGSDLQTLMQKYNFSCESPYWYLWASLDETLQPFCNTQRHNTSAVGKVLCYARSPQVFPQWGSLVRYSCGRWGGALCKGASLCEGTGTVLGFPVTWICGTFFRLVVSFECLCIQIFAWIKFALLMMCYPIAPPCYTLACIVGWLQNTQNGFLSYEACVVGEIQE